MMRDGMTPDAMTPDAMTPDAMTPVVLVHGLVISSRYMVPLAERLARALPTFAPDMPGFGRSNGPREALDIPALAAALAAWLRARGMTGAVLVGNSLGCQVITELAATEPSLARALVLAGPTFDPGRRSTPALMARLALDATRERLSLIPAQAADLARAGIGRGWRTYRHALAHRIETTLPGLRMPVLVVRGTRDPLVSHRWTDAIARGLARGSLVEIAGAPHAVNYSAPAPFARIILDFVARLPHAAGVTAG